MSSGLVPELFFFGRRLPAPAVQQFRKDLAPDGLQDRFVQRVRDGPRGIHGEGVTELAPTLPPGEMQKKAAGKAMQIEYDISSLSLEPGENGPATVKLDGFALSLVGDGRAQLKTDVTLRDGEKVVVGTSTVPDKGLVVVVSARVIL